MSSGEFQTRFLRVPNVQKLFKEETKDLKEAIYRQGGLLEECVELLRRLDVGVHAGKKKTSKPAAVLVPAQIKQSVRDGYKYSVQEKNLNWITKTATGTILKCNSEENKEMTEAICVYVKGQYPSTEEGVIRAGIETYYVTTKQKRHMEEHGSKERHNKKMVMYGRKNRKLQNRLKALKLKTLPREEELKIMKGLTIDYMSSEDSDSEDDTVLITRPLTWLSSEYKTMIARLDSKYQKSLNIQGRRLRSKRSIGRPSDRTCPRKPEGLEWIFA